jgi:hypothetical protein
MRRSSFKKPINQPDQEIAVADVARHHRVRSLAWELQLPQRDAHLELSHDRRIPGPDGQGHVSRGDAPFRDDAINVVRHPTDDLSKSIHHAPTSLDAPVGRGTLSRCREDRYTVTVESIGQATCHAAILAAVAR